MTLQRSDKTIIFKDYPQFRPNLTPKQIFQSGAFGGTYFRPIYSNITKKKYNNAWKEFPPSWFQGLDILTHVASEKCDKNVNKYKVKSGSSLEYWERQGWIKAQDLRFNGIVVSFREDVVPMTNVKFNDG